MLPLSSTRLGSRHIFGLGHQRRPTREIRAFRRGARTRRPGGRQLRLSRLHQLCRRGRETRFFERFSGRAPFHRLWPSVGVDEPARLSGRPHRAHSARHRGRGVAWHNPILVAEQAATLDLLSNGRLDFGVGKGYRTYEFSGFCIPPEEATERFDEAMGVIRKAWTSQGRFSHHGKRWHFDNVVVEPYPIQSPHPPFWLGAGSAESIRRAARDGYNLLLDQIAPTDLIMERVATFRHECERVGRRYDPLMVGVTRGLQIVHNEEERKRAIITRRQVLKNIGDLARGPGAERYAHIKDDEDSFELDDAPLLGTPEEIIAQLKRLEAGGVENVLFAAPGASVAGLRTFAEEIMPAFEREPMALAQV